MQDIIPLGLFDLAATQTAAPRPGVERGVLVPEPGLLGSSARSACASTPTSSRGGRRATSRTDSRCGLGFMV